MQVQVVSVTMLDHSHMLGTALLVVLYQMVGCLALMSSDKGGEWISFKSVDNACQVYMTGHPDSNQNAVRRGCRNTVEASVSMDLAQM